MGLRSITERLGRLVARWQGFDERKIQREGERTERLRQMNIRERQRSEVVVPELGSLRRIGRLHR